VDPPRDRLEVVDRERSRVDVAVPADEGGSIGRNFELDVC
jgi:hypothetical protein